MVSGVAGPESALGPNILSMATEESNGWVEPDAATLNGLPVAYLGWIVLGMFTRSQDAVETAVRIQISKSGSAGKVARRPDERLSDEERISGLKAIVAEKATDVPIDDVVRIYRHARDFRNEKLGHDPNVMFTMTGNDPVLAAELRLLIRQLSWLERFAHWVSQEIGFIETHVSREGGWDLVEDPRPPSSPPK